MFYSEQEAKTCIIGTFLNEICLGIPSWTMTPEAKFLVQDENEFVSGQFIWTGFDYLGEPSPASLAERLFSIIDA